MKILLTGAGGGVAQWLRPLLLARYGSLVVSDCVELAGLAEGESFRHADLEDAAAVEAACSGMDGIIHLGGQSVEASWDVVNRANIQGVYNLFEGARRCGVSRVVFASSNHAVGMYPRKRKIGVGEKPRPDSRYGLSKVFGEAMGALYADKYGLRVLSIRIGNVLDYPVDRRRLSIWLHAEDLLQLCAIGLEHPDLHNEIVYGISDNERSFSDNETAFRLGYRPRHRAEDVAAAALAADAVRDPDPIGDRFQGGDFATAEFSGDLDRTAER